MHDEEQNRDESQNQNDEESEEDLPLLEIEGGGIPGPRHSILSALLQRLRPIRSPAIPMMTRKVTKTIMTARFHVPMICEKVTKI